MVKYFLFPQMLQKSSNGYFLMVEGAKIDMAHHGNWAMRALNQTVSLDKAIESALSMVDVKETLVIVTADHSHGFSFSGHADRGSDVTGNNNTLGVCTCWTIYRRRAN